MVTIPMAMVFFTAGETRWPGGCFERCIWCAGGAVLTDSLYHSLLYHRNTPVKQIQKKFLTAANIHTYRTTVVNSRMVLLIIFGLTKLGKNMCFLHFLSAVQKGDQWGKMTCCGDCNRENVHISPVEFRRQRGTYDLWVTPKFDHVLWPTSTLFTLKGGHCSSMLCHKSPCFKHLKTVSERTLYINYRICVLAPNFV